MNLPNGSKLEKVNFIIRFIVIISIVIIFSFLCIARMMKIQIVDSEYYISQSQKNYTANQSVQAPRGQIFDASGNPLNTNKIVYKVIFQRAFLPFGQENEIIERTLSILTEYGEVWNDSVPITRTEPFSFTDVSEKELDDFKSRIEVNVDASVENCIRALSENFNISNEYDAETARAIAGVRYEMKLRDFSYNNRFTLAEDISYNTFVNLKEQNINLSGIDIIIEPMRVYVDADIAAHTRGSIGLISSEEYEEYKEQGYSLNDTIGKSGIELAMESILRGENGVRTIVRNSRGAAVSDEITTNVKPGNSVKLTIDSKFQQDLQDILENHISWLRTLNQTYDNTRYNTWGNNTEGGAVVVLDAKNGRVLGMANYPTYDINDYLNNYAEVLNAELKPLNNRSTTGLYRPGSSFKTITGITGLYNGIIAPESTVACGGVYSFFSDYKPTCTGTHGVINVIDALKWSCNIFFYDVGRRLGIDTLAEAASHFGVGTNLGLETGGLPGRMTSPDVYERVTGEIFTSGTTVQAAIGQSETLLTPLHMAVQAMTLANNGERYKPYMVDSVWDYDGKELVYKTEPVIVDSYATDRQDLYEVIKQGMIAVTDNIVWPPTDMSKSHFDYLPSRAAVKTGTPQNGDGTYNSVVLGYYPAEDPQIAFAVVLENGEFSRYIIRNIIDAYFYNAYEPDINEEGLIASPWKRWSEEKRIAIIGH